MYFAIKYMKKNLLTEDEKCHAGIEIHRTHILWYASLSLQKRDEKR